MKRGLRNADGVPWSKWPTTAKVEHMMRTKFPIMYERCQKEYKFCDADWALDYAWPAELVAIEIDGRNHSTAWNRQNDNDKRNNAVCAGWRVLVFTTNQAGSMTGATDACDMAWDLIADRMT